jgi:hypothetical protein
MTVIFSVPKVFYISFQTFGIIFICEIALCLMMYLINAGVGKKDKQSTSKTIYQRKRCMNISSLFFLQIIGCIKTAKFE